MSPSVCLAPAGTLYYPEGGGHLWVYLNWALALRALGYEVIWLEGAFSTTPPRELQASVGLLEASVRTLKRHLQEFGLADSLALYSWSGQPLPARVERQCLDVEAAAGADLLLSMDYSTPAHVVRRFRRSALVDIDPGLLQLWMSSGQVSLARHDVYFTIGETVGTRGARFPDCGLEWHYTPPPVFLPAWPASPAEPDAPYTTVSNWWGEWMEVDGEIFPNGKRDAFLEYLDLPAKASARLELGLCLGPWDEEERRSLEQRGWLIRHAWDVTSTPEEYRRYVRRSRGEFSCAKPSCVRLENAWISDRTLCYLASGKPAVVQHTGPSRFLPEREGLWRFKDVDGAARALAALESDYERHCQLARELVEEYFDAEKGVERLLERALA